MDFTKLEGFKVIYYLVLLIVFVALMVFLLRSAKESPSSMRSSSGSSC